MNLFYKISIDHVNANYISGWCCSRLNPSRGVDLECYASDGSLVASVRADRFREDMKTLGLHPSGMCGFEIIIPPNRGDRPHIYTIREKQSGRELVEIDCTRNRVRYRNPLTRFKLKSLLSRKKNVRPVVFMHIPKTAGTSFNTLAQKLYGGDEVRTHIELLDNQQRNRVLSSCRYISGHLRYHDMQRLCGDADVDYYTIVREPYSQLHSHLKWLIQVALDETDTYFKHTNPPIHNLGLELAEIQTFTADVLHHFVARMRSLEALFFENGQTRYFLDENPERVTDRHIQNALDNRKAFTLIGTTEHYASFVEAFCRINNLDKPDLPERLNRSKTDDLFDYRDADVRAALEPLVHYDLQLYKAVKAG